MVCIWLFPPILAPVALVKNQFTYNGSTNQLQQCRCNLKCIVRAIRVRFKKEKGKYICLNEPEFLAIIILVQLFL